ncbi:unnamed protein product [Mytilus edulis]|uniref:Major facilitator superfamily (MFS) profile domain-containing protein n=1 Tax=Mytilus edulis TaxID=6550 RepID=A0A8S3UPH3_MYTED|nr:unnamed protein product [Mytilus edulis]
MIFDPIAPESDVVREKTNIYFSVTEIKRDEQAEGELDMTILDSQKPAKYYTEENQANDDKEKILHDEPEVLSKPRIFLLNLSWYGLSLMFLLLSVEVVPAQVHALVGDAAKGRWLGGMIAGGAAVTFFLSPCIGMASDRLTLQIGKRRPIMIFGTTGLCIGLIGMALSASHIKISDLVEHRCKPYYNGTTNLHTHRIHNGNPSSLLVSGSGNAVDLDPEPPGDLALYIIFYLLVTAMFATINVPYNALIADKSNSSQRGFNSGVMGCMILLGNVSGAAVGTCFTEIGVIGAYATAISVVIISVCVTVFTTTENPGKVVNEPVGCIAIFCGFWQPLKEHDFRWVFITRFLMQQGVSTVTGFLEYWVSDMIQLPFCWNAARTVAFILLPLLFSASVGSVIMGIVSDRIGKRKIIVIIAAVMMSISCTALTFVNGENAFWMAFIIAFFFGMGLGTFQSIDFALVMDVLPDEKDKAKDIAVWHQALVLPNAIATPTGGIILDYFESVDCTIGLGYIILFAVTAFYFLLSAIFVTKIKRAN